MAKKAMANAHCLLEMIDRAPVSALRAFSTLDECQGLIRGLDWAQNEAALPAALKQHVANLKNDRRVAAEREAMRVLRLATPESAQVLTQVALQLDDEHHRKFHQQEGGEIGRAIWMRTASHETARLFDAAESILNAADFRGCKRLYDAFDVPCANPPPFVWNDEVRKDLEAQLTQSMRLRDSCEVIYVPLVAETGGETKTTHYLIVRFAGDQVQALEVVNRNRRSFWYYPARDATLVYSPEHRRIEVCAHTLSTRQPLANVLSKHGFKVPLSNRPLNRSCYDLSRFAQSLQDVKPVIDGVKVERLRLTCAEALIGHHTDTVKAKISSGVDLHAVIGPRWSGNPFEMGGAIIAATLVAEFVFDGEIRLTRLEIELAEPGRCSLQNEKDPRLVRVGNALLDTLKVIRHVTPGNSADDPAFILQVANLVEFGAASMDGFALAKLGIDIDRFEREGVIVEGERLTHTRIESAQGQFFEVELNRRPDPACVEYADPLTGDVVTLPASHARKWKLRMDWLREQLVDALGTALRAARGKFAETEPVLLGDVDIDGHNVSVYFATKMSSERGYAKVDSALRLHPLAVPGIVLTTAAIPFPFAGTNVVIPIAEVLASAPVAGAVIDMGRLKAQYRHRQMAARGGSSVRLEESADGTSAVLHIPGKAPWRMTGKAKIAVLRKLVDAFASGVPQVQTKKLMDDTGCQSPGQLFPKKSYWRDYLVAVPGARAWQLNIPAAGDAPKIVDDPVDLAA
jgi:hypothetical protein